MYIHHTYWIFLLVSTACFWAAPRSYRVPLLAALSIGYIATQDLTALALALASLAVATVAMWRTEAGTKHSGVIALALAAALLAQLVYYKHAHVATASDAGVAASTALMPLGLSFFTFKMIDYCVRTLNGEIPRQPPARTLLYFFLFPVFPAGPMARCDSFFQRREDTWSREAWVEGLTRIVQGLVKKFALADALLLAYLHRTTGTSTMAVRMATEPRMSAWLDLVAFQFYLYLDFSAYSDLAIGGARLFGFRIPENFRFPLLAANIGEFWRRWHITLSDLCRLYIFRPLLARTRNVYLAMSVTMLVIALWHGTTAGWLAWGAYHAVGLCIYALYRKAAGPPPENPHPARSAAGWTATLLFVSSACAFLTAPGASDWRDGVKILQNLFWRRG